MFGKNEWAEDPAKNRLFHKAIGNAADDNTYDNGEPRYTPKRSTAYPDGTRYEHEGEVLARAQNRQHRRGTKKDTFSKLWAPYE